MDKEKRKGLLAVPKDLTQWLNFDQKSMLSTIENYGWELKFIRRTDQEEPIVIVLNPQGDQIGVLEPDGQLNLDNDIIIR